MDSETFKAILSQMDHLILPESDASKLWTKDDRPRECVCNGTGTFLALYEGENRERACTDAPCFCQKTWQVRLTESKWQTLWSASDLPLPMRVKTFAKFDMSQKDNRAMATEVLGWLQAQVAAQLGREAQTGTKPWLALFGRVGCGKSHMAAAVTNGFIRFGVKARYCYVPLMLQGLRKAYAQEGEFYEELDRIMQAKVLVLDDLGAEKLTEWAREQLTSIVNYRYMHELPMLITTNKDVGDPDKPIRGKEEEPLLPPRIGDRLRDRAICAAVVNDAPSYRPKNKR